jgi:hypothetical protein
MEKIIEEIKEYDDRGNVVYYRNPYSGYEFWHKYDKNNNIIHSKGSNSCESWREYDEDNNLVHFKDSADSESWFKWKENERTRITKQEFDQIKEAKEHKEFLSREYVPRFELMEI